MLAVAVLAPKAVAGLTFSFTPSGFVDSTVQANYLAAAQTAGARWSSLFTDNITVNVTLKYDTSVSGGTIANTTLTAANYAYSGVYTALGNDITTATDQKAFSYLQPGSTTGLVFGENQLAGNTGFHLNGGNHTTVSLTSANAKALGLIAGGASGNDFNVNLSSSLITGGGFDLNPNDGISSGQYDLVGVIAHEIGHGLGMQSLTELISTSGTLLSENGRIPRLADLFRFSTRSIAYGTGVFDVAADSTAKYFSVDGGTTPLGNFALGSGSFGGNGQQANHWLATVGQPKLGIMDSVIATGQALSFTTLDKEFFDALGYNAVPEAGTFAAGGVLLASLWAIRRRR